MQEFTPSQKLDNILLLLAKNYKPGFETIVSITSGMNQEDIHETYLILNKLIRDNYVEYKDEIINGTLNETITGNKEILRRYNISFEGLYFIKDREGYQGLDRERSAENIRLDKLELAQKENQTSMVVLNCWVAVGTIAAAVIALAILLLQWYFDLHPVASK
jgi:hypothetical protein